ncbi:hypothetical protein [Shewanella cyperi]|uniref:hypothetical protein n=1 Tax=Shewanella cyperi TaxID=2814292 RepID=UPI001A945572|nr:hypothetical protein [Shewanella cyperi]QSX40803.1 hypothetical protein JYB84_17985 [Shewanella cyperi]
MKSSLSLLPLILFTCASQADTGYWLDLGWDSQYVSEGRDNIGRGGVWWGGAAVSVDSLTAYATLARGDSEFFSEWNLGLEYELPLGDDWRGSLGYQRVEIVADEPFSDNEWFASLAWWLEPRLVPVVAYTYSSDAAGYFVELSLYSHWQLTESLELTPFVTQGLDYQYMTELHSGRNHLQWGVKAIWTLDDGWSTTLQLAHSEAQGDVILDDEEGDLNFISLHLSREF